MFGFSITQFVLLGLGIVLFVASFVIPERRSGKKSGQGLGEKEIKELLDKQMEDVTIRISDVVDDTISYAVEKTERSMERLTNEKIMAVNEYSDTVLNEIHKNHEEVVFLYDMLNDKHKDLTNMVSEVEKTAKDARASISEAAQLSVAPETNSQMPRQIGPEETGRVLGYTGPGENPPFTGPQTGAEAVAEESPARQDQARDMMERLSGIIDTPTGPKSFKPFIPPVVNKADQAPREEGPSPAQAVDTAVAGRDQADNQEIRPITLKAPQKQQRARRNPTRALAGQEAEDMPQVSLSFAGESQDGRNNNQRILALHREGKSNMAIARELGLGVGEVKLVVDLFR